MFSHALMLALLIMPADITDQPVKTTPELEKLTTLTIDDMTFTARAIQFRSDNGSHTCTLEGDAKVTFGDITVTADKIQSNGKRDELESLICTGTCTWQQEDGSGDVFSGDKLESDQNGLRLTGNASLRYGATDHMTVITCDSISARFGQDGYELSGAVRLQHRK